jgi:hypothetical protein
MATNTPQIYGPDGVAREALSFTTTMGQRFLTGIAGTTTAATMEVSINGAPFTDDTDLITFDGVNWTVPNPAAFPQGLDLLPDPERNVIAVRFVSSTGVPSASATANIVYVQTLPFTAAPPTNVSVLRKDTSVVVYAEPTPSPYLVGTNVYASVSPGGGTAGYTRINVNVVVTGEMVEETASIGTAEYEYLPSTTPLGELSADPLYVAVIGIQEDSLEQMVEANSDFKARFEVPETTTRIRTSLAVDSVRTYTRYSFEHSRTAQASSTPPTIYVSSFASLDDTTPVYYVTTAVYYDPATLVETESPFSLEVAGNPLRVTAQVGDFPVVSRQQIIRDTITAILRSNPQVRVDPGSVLRDTFIDPFANEAERIRFVVDFLHRAQSFAGLLEVDDPANTGTSVPVGSSTYKTALKLAFRLSTDQETQDVIDRSFEALASNFGIFRRVGRASRGEVTFYTTVRPTESILIPVGTIVSAGSVSFAVVQAETISLSQLASYYDPVTGRYTATVAVQATTPGAVGNIASGQVRRVTSGPSNLSVTNNAAMFGGTDQESNKTLAERARNALASVDSGTKQGYLQIAADVPGVLRANVVAAGDDLMMRDLYDGNHIGGKVDVWVQGTATATVTDVFAFEYDIARDIHFVVVGDPANLMFRAIDPALSLETPISQMLDAPALGYAFRNATTGFDFDLTGVTITRYDTIQLDTAIPQPSVSLTDVVLGDYRRLQGNDYVFRRQPVDYATTVAGTLSGVLSQETYAVYKPDSPLLTGYSTLASDFLRITPVGGVPSGGMVAVSDESHVLLGEYPEYLESLGVDVLTIVVTNYTGTVTYSTSGDPLGFYDYAVVPGTATTPTSIVRVPTGRIADGETVLVSYQHGENFSVTYVVNQVPTQVQLALNARRHITADVLAKAAIPWNVNIVATVVLLQGASRTRVDANIRSAITALFNNKRLGDPLRQSDVIGVIEGVAGVSYVLVPLTQMCLAEGTMIVRDEVRSTNVGDSTYIAAWSTPTVSVWLLTDPLIAVPQDGGGTDTMYHAVTQDVSDLSLVPYPQLGLALGQAYIVGGDGLIIPGVSDDATLQAQGYLTTAEILTARAQITGRRVLVSTSVDDSPERHAYVVTYETAADPRVYDLDPGPCQFLQLNPQGGLTLTYDEDR